MLKGELYHAYSLLLARHLIGMELHLQWLFCIGCVNQPIHVHQLTLARIASAWRDTQ